MLLSFFFGDDFGVFRLGQSRRGIFSAHAFSLDVDAMGIVDDAVAAGQRIAAVIQFFRGFAEARHGWTIPCNGE